MGTTRVNSDGVEIVTKAPSFRDKIAKVAEQSKNGEEINLDGLVEHPAPPEIPRIETSTESAGTESNTVKEITPPAQVEKKEKGHFRKLEEGLLIANRQLEDYKTRAEKTKDYDELKARAEAAEAKLKEIEPKFQESEQWRAQHNIMRSDEFNERIVLPRKQIAEVIKAELKVDGIDESVWDKAQAVGTRYELEKLVNGNIKSDLLKSQFYDLYFKDLELRKAEHAALSAPVQWMESQKREEAHKREAFRAEQNRTFDTVWKLGEQQATEMNDRLGENRIIELSYIQGNKKHNEEVVKPIVELASKNARAELQDMILSGRPVDAKVAAGVIYKWQQAIAGQHAHHDRLRWFNEASRLKKELDSLTEKHNKLLERASPVPGGNGSNGNNGNGKVAVQGETMTDRIHSFAQSYKSDSR